MVTARFYIEGDSVGLSMVGHAGHSQKGEDIVCAAISAITQTAMMGLQHFAPNTQAHWEAGEDPILVVRVPNPNHDTEVILRTMVIGLEDILSGVPDYVRIIHN